ncbi:MAG TPA: hypothetical protein VLD58_11325 [Gemmatimonadales bacterium]|nr:hypothetical protein [Gemmatimonadales bacterium]
MILAAPLALAALLAATAPGVAGSLMAQDTAALEFFGFRAGAPLSELEALARSHRGRLRCARSRTDPRVSECHGTVGSAALSGAARLWISAIDSVAAVITLSAPVDSARLDRWRTTIERRYGRVTPRVQGSQQMLQWVRRRRMLRLTWRDEKQGVTASVSLVDGRVLDRWGLVPRPGATTDRDQRSRIRKLPSESSRK